MVNLNEDLSLWAAQRVWARCVSLSLSPPALNEGRERGDEAEGGGGRREEGGGGEGGGGGGRNSNDISDR